MRKLNRETKEIVIEKMLAQIAQLEKQLQDPNLKKRDRMKLHSMLSLDFQTMSSLLKAEK
jgi:endonuclease III-like uncharacterized protein